MKTPIDRFLSNKPTIKILGEKYTPSNEETLALNYWFSQYKIDKSRDWFKQLSIWITKKALDFVARRKKLEEIGIYRMTEETFEIRYLDGGKKYQEWLQTRAQTFNIEFWIKRGLTKNEAKNKISKIQKNNASQRKETSRRTGSHRTIEFYLVRGYSEEAAKKIISERQSRGLNYFIAKYGTTEGTAKYKSMCLKRKTTWQGKDKKAHGLRTLSNKWNPNGLESQAILGFIRQNNLENHLCLYGPASKQFFQWIPSVGFRRYDLAVFNNNDSTDPIYIVEFHGPIHINFSDYTPQMKNKKISDENGRILPYDNTYGAVYENDKIKRKQITSNFANCEYIVIWWTDIKNGNFTLEYLRQSRKNRLLA